LVSSTPDGFDGAALTGPAVQARAVIVAVGERPEIVRLFDAGAHHVNDRVVGGSGRSAALPPPVITATTSREESHSTDGWSPVLVDVLGLRRSVDG
jgi:hypothetical protein